MVSCKILYALMSTLVASMAAIPEHLLCCSPDTATFQYQSNAKIGCWDEKSNKTSKLLLKCPTLVVFPDFVYNLTVTESGQVFHIDPYLDEPLEFKRGESCFANETDPETGEVTNVVVSCEEPEEDLSVLGYCTLVSAVFLLLTMLVYAALPEIRDLQGKSIINFCGSMGVGVAFLSGSKLSTYPDMTSCAIGGFLTYFFLLASFFWTNAISVQVLLSLRRPVVNNYSWKEFSWYALYAWGCPTVLTLCMAIVNFHPGDHKKSGIGLNTCWFYNTTQQWYYLYSVMTILIIANICIFIYTSVYLWRTSFSSSQVKALRYKFVMSLRMFIIMGITWIFEMISSLTEKNVIWSA